MVRYWRHSPLTLWMWIPFPELWGTIERSPHDLYYRDSVMLLSLNRHKTDSTVFSRINYAWKRVKTFSLFFSFHVFSDNKEISQMRNTSFTPVLFHICKGRTFSFTVSTSSAQLFFASFNSFSVILDKSNICWVVAIFYRCFQNICPITA